MTEPHAPVPSGTRTTCIARRPLLHLPALAVALSVVSFAGSLVFGPGAWLSTAAAGKDAAAPKVIDPGDAGHPPSDAIVLFDGTDLSEWVSARDGGPARWKIEAGELVIEPGSGDLHSKRKLGDIQLHIEWMTPAPEPGKSDHGESRGNSGIKLHTRYEIQILDNFDYASSPLGQAGSVYKQHAPLVNACRAPGKWQTYDIVFRDPRFDDSGQLTRHGRVTVLHNGVLVQDNAKILGPTNSNRPATPEYRKPLLLQDHGSTVRFRNIWIRELEPRIED